MRFRIPPPQARIRDVRPAEPDIDGVVSGMIGMARTWALELGPHGITVNVVAPGPIEATEMFHEVMPVGDPRIAALAGNIPVKRLGTPADVANAVSFFAAPAAGFVTGQVLYVCGGASIGAVSL